MPGYKYETHVISDPLLPFIFHRCYRHTQHQSPPNWHENIEILFCVEGSGYVKCGIDATPFFQGDIFVVNADIPHSVGSDETIAYRCLIIDNSFCADNGIPIGELTFRSTIRDRELAALFETVTAAYARREDGDILATADIRFAVLGLLRKLWREYAAPRQVRPETDALIKQALTYIRQNLSGPITLDAISCSVGISKYHLSRQFKSFTGKTVIDTVNLIRCTEAKRLIEGGMRISAAAAACGYENLSYFTRTFKKLFHALPSSFLPKKTQREEFGIVNLPQRKQNRLHEYDYSTNGAYFVTICTYERQKTLSNIVGDGSPVPTPFGRIAEETIKQITNKYPLVSIDKYVIMPDHIHLLLRFDIDNGTGNPSPTLGNVIGWYKYQTTKHINLSMNTPGSRIFQRSYYDHVIRHQQDYDEIWQHIENNPQKWLLEHPLTK